VKAFLLKPSPLLLGLPWSLHCSRKLRQIRLLSRSFLDCWIWSASEITAQFAKDETAICRRSFGLGLPEADLVPTPNTLWAKGCPLPD